MKKKLFMLLLAGCATLAANAQQVNGDFDGTWEACVPYVSGSKAAKQVGTQPSGWKAANVMGYYFLFGWTGTTEVVSKDSGYDNTANSVKLTNKEVLSNNIPAYFCIGTPWNTANTTGGNADGGSFGGKDFAYRPDALSFYYKRSIASGNSQPATVVAYTWTGTWTQQAVPANVASSATKVTMTDRDRNILGMATNLGGTVSSTSDAKLIASINTNITETASDWTLCTLDFDYKVLGTTPQKINIIFAANDYFGEKSAIEKDNTLTIDAVKLVYYSQLSDLKFNGATLAGFNKDTYAYEVEGMYTEGCLTYTVKGVAATTEGFVYNEATKTATCVVRNEDDGSSHTYTVKFNTPTYDYADGSAFAVAPGVYNVKINRTFNAGWSTICLPFATTTSALGAGVKAQALSSASETTLSFTGTETLEANKPYLVYFPSAVNSLSFTEVTVEEQAPVAVTFGAWSFEGTYAASKLMSGLYGVAKQNGEDKILMGGTRAQIKATRAFFSTTAANVKEMGIEIDGVATAIDNVEMAGKKTFDVYSVSGALMRQGATSLNGLHSGLYIINGKKVLVK